MATRFPSKPLDGEGEKARQAIMAEVRAALADCDLLTVGRIYARLTHEPIEAVVAEAVERAIAKSGETPRRAAQMFAEGCKALREITGGRRTA